ncbi:MAG: tRNA threonylcarbamoyladenosine dehydratase [Comamonadaceae bacterium CG1_02_60_18]|nr:MAG: tRNA threonylcarbamoyladenosine dehydratase [Comamonadaceae bacterium CG1_02_60_18]PIQ51466.1 MAG: tRNA threonylcarbamoyladenosine dehydratase [Comamonadaceae bacterium CG12_big_fil_rev_8_21_14_0_65_59_15]
MTEDRRFSALSRLFGVTANQRIRSAHVVVVGIGGVGSWAAESLARSGVGRITLVDLDHVAESNINRQIHATVATLGQAKVVAMRERIASFFPDCNVQCIDDFATPSNWLSMVPADAAAVIDACDQVTTKICIAHWALESNKIFVTSGAAGGKRHAHRVDVDDLSHVTHDPLLAKVRYTLRRHYGAPRGDKRMHVACVYSTEAVAPPDASCQVSGDGTLNCHGFGSLVTVTAAFGLCAAGYVLNQLAGQNTPGKP